MDQPLNITLAARRRWWFGIAATAGWAACILRLLTERQAERFVEWLVERGMVIEVR